MRKLNINYSTTSDAFTIVSEQKRFYQELCTSYQWDDDEVKNFLNVLDIPKLTEEQKHVWRENSSQGVWTHARD